MQQIIDLLAKLPSGAWVIFGGVLPLIGAWFTDRGHKKRLAAQLRHDAEQRDKERFHALRKEVYLKAVEELVSATSHLGKLTRLDPTKDDIDAGTAGFSVAVAKLQLVAGTDAAKFASELSIRFAEIFFQLSAKASFVHSINTDIRIADDLLEKHQAAVKRILAEMTQLNESGQNNPERFAALNRSFDWSQSQAEQYVTERNESLDKRSEMMRDYAIHLLQELKSILPLQTQLIAAICGELGLATDVLEFEARLKTTHERMARAMETLLEQLRAHE